MSNRPTRALNYIDETYTAVSANVELWRDRLADLSMQEDLTDEDQMLADDYLGHLLFAQNMLGRIGHIRLLVTHDLTKALQQAEGEKAE